MHWQNASSSLALMRDGSPRRNVAFATIPRSEKKLGLFSMLNCPAQEGFFWFILGNPMNQPASYAAIKGIISFLKIFWAHRTLHFQEASSYLTISIHIIPWFGAFLVFWRSNCSFKKRVAFWPWHSPVRCRFLHSQLYHIRGYAPEKLQDRFPHALVMQVLLGISYRC